MPHTPGGGWGGPTILFTLFLGLLSRGCWGGGGGCSQRKKTLSRIRLRNVDKYKNDHHRRKHSPKGVGQNRHFRAKSRRSMGRSKKIVDFGLDQKKLQIPKI
jgi:hypothetical protein